MTRPKALVTGGAGFIGSHLCEALLAKGWEVWALDDLSTGSKANVEALDAHAAFHLVVESVLSPAVTRELVDRVDVVYHLAAAVGVRLIIEQPVHTMVTNVAGTTNVLQSCTEFGKRVLIASSSEIYGDHREERPLREDDRRVYGPVTERRWRYADSKAIDESLAFAFHEELGLDCVLGRIFNTVGPRQQGRYGMVIPRFVANALSGEPLEVHGDGLQTRSFCHVADTIEALTGLMESDVSGEVFNVGSTERVRILDLAQRVLELTASASELVFVPQDEVYGLGIEDVLHREPAIQKIRQTISWSPSRSLEDILRDVVAHTRARSAG